MRYTFYKINLRLSNGQELPITLATTDIQRVEGLVESKKVLYDRKDYKVTGFYITDTRYPLGMTDEIYETEVSYCDIVDEVE